MSVDAADAGEPQSVVPVWLDGAGAGDGGGGGGGGGGEAAALDPIGWNTVAALGQISVALLPSALSKSTARPGVSASAPPLNSLV
ncbi:hypothetical protein [Sphingomonas sp.]|uniref:hypothetical protein n=1 Tax=Sphingomonas sp. TaxID=28214 RepID=UPI003CC6D903